MKKLLFFFLLIVSTSTHAQDVIVKKDGSTIISKVLEVGTSDVKYKKISNSNGPIYTISKSDILSINYKNGERDTFDNIKSNEPASESTDASQRYIEKPADARNAEIIALYNKIYSPTKQLQKSKKSIKGYMMIFGVTSSSVMSNEDIEISLVREVQNIGRAYQHVVYSINIKNKIDKTIYIDKGNCFKIWNDGTSYCYYEPTEQTTVSSGSGRGVSLGMGSIAGVLGIGGAIGQIASGISVGGGKNQSVSRTYNQQRVIAIPAHANRNLSNEKSAITKDAALYTDVLMVDQSESFNFEELKSSIIKASDDNIDFGGSYESDFSLPNGLVNMGETLYYNENESPYHREYVITYSTDENFKTFSSLRIGTYLHEIIGCDKLYKKNMYGERTILSNKYIDGVNQYMIEGYYDIE